MSPSDPETRTGSTAPVVLINPPRLSQLTRRTSYTREPHLGLGYVAAAIRESGHGVRLLDAEALDLDLEEAVCGALRGGPLYVGFTADTTRVKSAALVAAEIKRRSPATPTVIGGYHATVLPERTLQEFGAFDYGVVGEGERAAVDLARSLAAGERPVDIPGLAHRAGGEVRINPGRPPLRNLDRLPFPAWDLLPLRRYQAHYRTDNRVLELPVNTGRGCRGRCRFCARVSGDQIRRRSVDSIMDELEMDVGRYGAGAIVFFDETFTADPELVDTLCRKMVAAGLPRHCYWLCMTRVDAVTPALLRSMSAAGCRYVALGVESGDPAVLRRVGKPIDLDRARFVVSAAQQAGMKVDTFFVLGLPGETTESIRRTVQYAVDLDPDWATFFTLIPYPGTDIYAWAKRREKGLRLLTEDWDQYGIQMGRALELEGLSRQMLARAQLRAYLRFYLRPGKLGNMLRTVNLRVLPLYLLNLVFPGLARRYSRLRERHGTRPAAH